MTNLSITFFFLSSAGSTLVFQKMFYYSQIDTNFLPHLSPNSLKIITKQPFPTCKLWGVKVSPIISSEKATLRYDLLKRPNIELSDLH